MKVRYDGPGHLLKAFGTELERGATGEFTLSEARSLLAQPHIHVTVPDIAALSDGIDPDRPSRNGSRRQWKQYADRLGLNVLPSMTRDDIAAAVDASSAGTDASSS